MKQKSLTLQVESGVRSITESNSEILEVSCNVRVAQATSEWGRESSLFNMCSKSFYSKGWGLEAQTQ